MNHQAQFLQYLHTERGLSPRTREAYTRDLDLFSAELERLQISELNDVSEHAIELGLRDGWQLARRDLAATRRRRWSRGGGSSCCRSRRSGLAAALIAALTAALTAAASSCIRSRRRAATTGSSVRSS